MATRIGNSGNNTLNGTAGNDLILGNGGSDTLNGHGGADVIVAGAGGNDTINGGSGADKLVLEGNFADYTVSFSGSDVIFTKAGVVETVTGVEQVVFDDIAVNVVGAGSENATVQSGVDASEDGEAVLVAAGSYSETVTVDKDVTILGANAGVDAGGSRVTESTLTGGFNVTVAGVTIDGMKIEEGASMSGELAGVFVQAGDAAVQNTVFTRGGPVDADTSRGVATTGSATGLSVSGNSFTGFHTGVYLNPGVTGTVSGNTFTTNFVGLSFDTNNAGDVAVTSNAFTNNSFEQIGLGIYALSSDLTSFGLGSTFAGSAPKVSIYGLAGDGQLITGTGFDDTYNGDADDETFNGGVGNDTILGDGGDDTLNGDGAEDTINGGAGNDAINGGTDADAMTGGLGNDTFSVDHAGDTTVEASGEGTDTVNTSISYTLGAGESIEVFNSTGSGLSLTGNDEAQTINGDGGDNTLNGAGGNDTLDGGAGVDAMSGGMGDDTYWVDDSADTVSEASGEGTDTINVSAPSFTLAAAQAVEFLNSTGTDVSLTGNELAQTITGDSGDNTLVGGGGGDTLNGGAGNDTLDGSGAGSDAMTGGTGDDAFGVYDAGDTAVEAAGEGTDTVFAFVNYTLGAGQSIEFLTSNDTGLNLTGNELAQTITGDSGANTIVGGGGTDTLTGGAGEDVLDGGADADAMAGGADNDTYFVNIAGDTVSELVGEGTDTVNSSVTFTLSANVENLILTGGSNLNGTGNTGVNSLTGNSGNNVLNGLAGADTMTGGLGNDTYLVDNAGDVVVELAGQGTDTVSSTITYSLAGTQLENLQLTGLGVTNGTGNAFANTITGNNAANVMTGAEGNDLFKGNGGADTFNFTNLATGGLDRVLDFATGIDKIQVSAAGFGGGLTAGGPVTLVASAVPLPSGPGGTFLYNTTTGILSFDADGNGAGAAVQFLWSTNFATIAASDFVVVP